MAQFVLESPKLQIGEYILPDLVEFYLWLHNQLAYTVSYEKAAELKLGLVLRRVTAKYSKEFQDHINDLYERVKCKC